MNPEIKGLEGKELNPNHFGGMCSRQTVLFKRGENQRIDFEKGIETIATTEAPAIVVDWERWEYVREVLPMRYCDMSGEDKVVLLDTHSRVSVEKVLGSAKEFRTEGVDLLCKTFISETEEKIRTKIDEGHIDSVSLGYMTDKDFTVEIPKGASVTVDGIEYKNEFNDGTPFLVRTWWKKKELSLVPIGADAAAKFRAELTGKIKSEDPALQEKINKAFSEIENLKTQNQELTIKLNERTNKMSEKTEPTADEMVQQELERRDEINAISNQVKNGYKGGDKELADVTAKAIKEKWSAEKFRAHVWERFDFDKPLDTAKSNLDLSKKEVSEYSIIRALNYILFPGRDTMKAAEFELKCSNEIAERLGAPARGLYIPEDIQKKQIILPLNKRDLTVGGTGTGAELVGTDHLASSFIELLRNKMLLARLGAKTLGGLQGNVAIPKWTGASTAVWISTEGGEATESTPTTGSLTLSPKDLGASVDISRRLLLQSSPSVEGLVLDDIATVLAIAIDKAGFHGTASNGQPRGIALTTGIGSVTGASLNWPAVVEFESDVDTANALEGSFAYVTTPSVKGLCKTRVKESGFPMYLSENGNTMNGYPLMSSNQITAKHMFFGNFAQVIIAEWGVLDLYPTKLERTGTIILTGLKTVDVGVRQPGAFSLATDVD